MLLTGVHVLQTRPPMFPGRGNPKVPWLARTTKLQAWLVIDFTDLTHGQQISVAVTSASDAKFYIRVYDGVPPHMLSMQRH